MFIRDTKKITGIVLMLVLALTLLPIGTVLAVDGTLLQSLPATGNNPVGWVKADSADFNQNISTYSGRTTGATTAARIYGDNGKLTATTSVPLVTGNEYFVRINAAADSNGSNLTVLINGSTTTFTGLGNKVFAVKETEPFTATSDGFLSVTLGRSGYNNPHIEWLEVWEVAVAAEVPARITKVMAGDVSLDLDGGSIVSQAAESLDVIFNKEMLTGNFTSSNFSVKLGSTNVPVTITTVDEKTARLTFKNPLKFSSDYTLTVLSIKDTFGLDSEGLTLTFTTGGAETSLGKKFPGASSMPTGWSGASTTWNQSKSGYTGVEGSYLVRIYGGAGITTTLFSFTEGNNYCIKINGYGSSSNISVDGNVVDTLAFPTTGSTLAVLATREFTASKTGNLPILIGRSADLYIDYIEVFEILPIIDEPGELSVEYSIDEDTIKVDIDASQVDDIPQIIISIEAEDGLLVAVSIVELDEDGKFEFSKSGLSAGEYSTKVFFWDDLINIKPAEGYALMTFTDDIE